MSQGPSVTVEQDNRRHHHQMMTSNHVFLNTPSSCFDFHLIGWLVTDMPEIAEGKATSLILMKAYILICDIYSRTHSALFAQKSRGQDSRCSESSRWCKCIRESWNQWCGVFEGVDGEESSGCWSTREIFLVSIVYCYYIRGCWDTTRLIMSNPPHPVFHFGMTGMLYFLFKCNETCWWRDLGWIQIRGQQTYYYKPKEGEEEVGFSSNFFPCSFSRQCWPLLNAPFSFRIIDMLLLSSLTEFILSLHYSNLGHLSIGNSL